MNRLLAGPLGGLLQIAAAALLILGVAAVSGPPSVFPDTAYYYSQGEYFGSAVGLAPRVLPPERTEDFTSLTPGGQGMRSGKSATIAGARSPLYGFFLWFSERVGTLWLTAALQAAASAWVLYILSRAAVPERAVQCFWALTAVLALGSSLPFFAAFMMPDIFSGLAICCSALLLVYPDRCGPAVKAALWSLLAAALAFHATNIATAIAFAGLGGLLLLARPTGRGRVTLRVAAIVGAAAVAVLIGIGSAAAFKAGTGVTQTSPPFLMARVLADGPGRAYLKAACPGGAAPTLCRFTDANLASVEAFLWADDPRQGVFSITDPATRRQLKREEAAFVLATVRRDPTGVFMAALKNWAAQLQLFYVGDPLRNPEIFFRGDWRDSSLTSIIPGVQRCEHDMDACAPRIPLQLLVVVHACVFALALGVFALAIRARNKRPKSWDHGPDRGEERRLVLLMVLLLAGVVVNAGVCGILSGPFARYQARLIWLVPAAAVILAFRVLPPFVRADRRATSPLLEAAE